MLGSLLASGFYHLLCYVRWENINPGQDYNEWETKAQTQKNLSVASENTMTDPIHNNNVNYSTATPPSPPGGNVNGAGYANQQMAESTPEQQV